MRVSSEITIGVDIGTTAIKSVAVDNQGRVRARSRIPNRVHATEPHSFEHDVISAWRDGPLQAVTQLGDARGDAIGLGVCACVPSLSVLDDDLMPLSMGVLYGDARGHAGGSPQPPPATPLDLREGAGFLSWAARSWPGARAYWPAQAVAAVALGGEPVIDIFTAMAFFPVFDGAGWDPEQLAGLGITADQLPRVDTAFGGPASRLAPGGPAGLRGPAVMVGGCVDVVAEQLTVEVAEPGDVHVLCGTTLVTWAVAEDDGDVAGLWRIPHHRQGMCLLGGPSNAGGLFLDWARRLSADVPEDDRGHPDRIPLWVPYVRGERAPLHDHSLRASLHDLDLTHDAMSLRRAAYEAAGFVVRRQLELAGCTPARIVATGGGVRDALWMQALADCTGAVVQRSSVPEGAAMGMAWVARMGAGLETSLDDARRWFRTLPPIYPDECWVKACDRRYERFRSLAGHGAPALATLAASGASPAV